MPPPQETPPKDSDLDAAFIEADEDQGGTVDLEEFIKLFAKIKKGEVKGMSGGMFSKKVSPPTVRQDNITTRRTTIPMRLRIAHS